MGWGIGNLGGGVGGLNFKIVGGTTLPSNPKENTIWVETDAPVTGWAFAVAAPSPATEGLVWIETGANPSDISFNILKKNAATIYPVAAWQYSNGIWSQKPAQIYKDGEWTLWWDGELYTPGNTYDAITGGWSVGDIYTDGYNNVGSATLTLNADSMVFAGGRNTVWTGNKIPVTNYDTLIWRGSATGYSFLQLSEEKKNKFSASASSSFNAGDTEVTVDISSLSGEFYVVLCKMSADKIITTTEIIMTKGGSE